MKNDLRQEQERLDLVTGTITEQMSKLADEAGRRRSEVTHIQRHFWDEVKVNTDTFDDYLETIIGLRQQAQALTVSQSTHRHAKTRLSVLERMQKSPYFGRIDFTEEGTKEPEKVYIGISSLTDSSGEDFLVYDWRAPVSSVYYDYPPGPAEYTTPGGVIKGNLETKWQYIIRGGMVESMFDTSLTIGDEILKEVLGKGTDKHMHSIVATIQQEQNRIIRHVSGRLLIVQGAAGSGKTSAAMQRIAYLLYKYRDRLKADQIILFSPNSMFNSYVSNVLPELGEENMQQVTFQEYMYHRLSGSFKVEDPYEQLEYVLTAADEPARRTRTASIRFKASTSFFETVKAYSHSLEESGMVFKGVKFRGKPFVSGKQMEERFYGTDTSIRFSNRIEKLQEWLNAKIDETEKAELNKPWVQEEIELLSKDEYQKAFAYLEKRKGSEEDLDDYEQEIKVLGRMVVRRKLKPLRKWVQGIRFVDFTALYRQLFSDPSNISNWMTEKPPEEWADICRMTMNMLDEGRLFYEDAPPFLFLKEQIQGFQTNTSIKHVLVDEAQDYSPFQFEFLKRLFPMAKMTVLGDFNQAIFVHASGLSDFHPLMSLYGSDETEAILLNQSYRSTKPITDFTRKLVPNGDQIVSFERGGKMPVLTAVSDRTELHRRIASKVADFQKQGHHSIAIICKSAAESSEAFGALGHIPDIKLVKSGSAEYEQGIVVIPAYLAKGIEFDAVIIYDASAQVYGDASLRRLFYTACTRALHLLQIYSAGEPCGFLQEVPRENLIWS
ncbi:RNA polymerase recycling motor HelD [Metabacillus indicus]|uniref:RNA polymerase recycling motor HelD n=1 Tax=Metabacillus indicus TaxID=246786 RepID=UPI00316C90C9